MKQLPYHAHANPNNELVPFICRACKTPSKYAWSFRWVEEGIPYCLKCRPSPYASKYCPKGHLLQWLNDYYFTFCKVCYRRCPSSTKWICYKCDFNVCSDCKILPGVQPNPVKLRLAKLSSACSLCGVRIGCEW
eukprot:TRINITY_DN2591_c0_g1_i1.p6 TRINITY_DN2591_c0_g1~~TRINITY_DN2591_c0_g1_i1.p6  ORF type:complete len:134 (-),score=4.55 TRINITY_DN2591_c0_g1_i1:1704-2105(-)